MSERKLLVEILRQLLCSIEVIERRSKAIRSPEALLRNDRMLEKLDALCMQLIAIGENIKNLEKGMKPSLLLQYPGFDWKSAMGMRDILSHHYFNVNAEIVFQVCKEEIPKLKTIAKALIEQYRHE
jgi:uncharacterized protein with HEPN domain